VQDCRPTQKLPGIFQREKGQPGHFLTLLFEDTFTGSVTEVVKGFRIQDRKTDVKQKFNLWVIFFLLLHILNFYVLSFPNS
jgi:hypothetical protein